MKRRSNSQKFQHRWKTKLFALPLLGLCVGTLVFMETQYCRIKKIALLPPPFVPKPKIAFLYIARNRLPLDMVWDAFFQGDKDNKFSISVHSRPGFLFNKATTRSAYFLDRQVNNSIQIGEKQA